MIKLMIACLLLASVTKGAEVAYIADHRGWTMIDCRLAPGRQPDRIPMASIKPELAARVKYPTNSPVIDLTVRADVRSRHPPAAYCPA